MRKLSILIIGIITVTAIYLWWENGLSAANPTNKTEVVFVIQKGEDVRVIANSLKQKNLIKDPVVFFLLVKKMGLDNKIQAGDFRISPSMTAFEIAQTLTHGTIDIWITIPEGKRAEEIADILKAKLATYQPSWRKVLANNEGYLFPDTYLIPKDADIDTIISIMKNNFENKYISLGVSKNNLSRSDIVTIASLVEREAKLDIDRPLVTSVILNRLKIGMKLDIDATIQYLLGYQNNEQRWWKKNLTIEDLKINSPYNTYRNPGLPPTPIANPGLATLKAVIQPAETDYLYYISDNTGKNHYAKTIEEHNANIKKFGL